MCQISSAVVQQVYCPRCKTLVDGSSYLAGELTGDAYTVAALVTHYRHHHTSYDMQIDDYLADVYERALKHASRGLERVNQDAYDVAQMQTDWAYESFKERTNTRAKQLLLSDLRHARDITQEAKRGQIRALLDLKQTDEETARRIISVLRRRRINLYPLR